MLEKPNLPDSSILDCLLAQYGLRADRLAFLPLGADVNTAVYRVGAGDRAFFVKLRKGPFDDLSVTLPHFLTRGGVPGIIAPLETRAGGLWAPLPPYTVLLYPFVEGKDGYEAALSERQWLDFGAALGQIHTLRLPPALAARIPRETFSPAYRQQVGQFQAQAEEDRFSEPVAARLAAFMRGERARIDGLVARGERLAQRLRERPPEFVLCHADLHAGNLLIGADGKLYIVDWDAPLYAPKEKDLSLVGGCSTWGAAGDVALFYQGYGEAKIDPGALAYYRCERILVDIAEFCKQLFLSDEGGPDREQSYGYFTGQFLAGHEVERALGMEEKEKV